MRQLVAALLLLAIAGARACSRVLYQSPSGAISVAARTMDWAEDPYSSLHLLPRGMDKHGLAGPRSLTWRSRHASLALTMYDLGTADAVNEHGLSGSLLFFTEADHGEAERSGRPLLTVAAWLQYAMDSFANVAEAVEGLRAEPFTLVGLALPNGRPATCHMQLTDAGGDSAVFEFVRNGTLTIYHSSEYTVMTNSPPYDEQLALARYWRLAGGRALPGTHRPADRFLNALHYLGAINKTDDEPVALAHVRGIMKRVTVPYGIPKVDSPGYSFTHWTCLLDQRRLRVYVERALSLGWQWVDMAKLNLTEGAPVLGIERRAAKAAAAAATAEGSRMGDANHLMQPLEGPLQPPSLAVRTDGRCDEVLACLRVWRAAQAAQAAAAAAGAPAGATPGACSASTTAPACQQ